ncbi:hypothetical protein KY289_019626 [Solanum tuberosum]|nr:hypothetical protein KY289_019626 [Solanum tuberosum]
MRNKKSIMNLKGNSFQHIMLFNIRLVPADWVINFDIGLHEKEWRKFDSGLWVESCGSEEMYGMVVVWYTRGGEEYASTPEAARNFLAFWYTGKDGEHRGSLVVRRSRQWYGKMKTVKRGTRLVRGNELVRQLMVFGFVEVGEG